MPEDNEPLAVFDLGTNSTRFLVAKSSSSGFRFSDVLLRGALVTALGEGLGESNRLSNSARQRVLEALKNFDRRLSRIKAVWKTGVATSACRRAENREDFFDEVEEVTAVRPRLLEGRQEARLTYLGVKSSLPHFERGIIIDIGGGSTEVIFYDKTGVKNLLSLDLGVVALKEKVAASRKYGSGAVEIIKNEVSQALEATDDFVAPLIVVGGTGTTAAAYLKGLENYQPEVVHGSQIEQTRVNDLIEKFAGMNFSKIEKHPVISAGRGAVMLPGLYILKGFMSRYNSPQTVVSDCGVLAGLLEEISTNDK